MNNKAFTNIDITITPENDTVSFKIPPELIGHKLKIVAYDLENMAVDTEDLLTEDEDKMAIPEWHRELVLAEKHRIEQDPDSLLDWDIAKKKIQSFVN